MNRVWEKNDSHSTGYMYITFDVIIDTGYNTNVI